jgi:CRP/FNR family transcriptional regulator, anaerobic regulatory protein
LRQIKKAVKALDVDQEITMAELFVSFIESLVTPEPGALDDLRAVVKERTVKKKEHFLKEGEVCRSVGFIKEGCIRLYYLRDGEDITKDFNFETNFCGSHASFSTQQPSRFNIVAVEDVILYEINRRDLYALYDKYKSFERLGRLLMEKMFDRKEQRESSFLLDDAEKRYEDLLKAYPQIVQRIPLKYIASYLGIAAETLSRLRAAK